MLNKIGKYDEENKTAENMKVYQVRQRKRKRFYEILTIINIYLDANLWFINRNYLRHKRI